MNAFFSRPSHTDIPRSHREYRSKSTLRNTIAHLNPEKIADLVKWAYLDIMSMRKPPEDQFDHGQDTPTVIMVPGFMSGSKTLS